MKMVRTVLSAATATVRSEVMNSRYEVKFAFRAFIREEFMELVEDMGAEVNRYSQRNEYMNIVLQYRMALVGGFISFGLSSLHQPPPDKGHMEAVKTLNTLQTNAQTLEKIRSERDKYAHLNIPNMLKYAERVGISEEDMDSLNVVHISGTKGKGSTCAFCESILRSHGYKTGFYSSPHLVEVRERFRIDGKPIQRETFASYFWDVYNRLEESKDCYEGKMPNYFGFLTVMALHVFLQEKVDVAIMEVGIGGQYDSTNLIKHPVVCGVSSLGIDHTSVLGSSIDKIAWHKAGIFKPGVPAFTAPQHEKAMEVLKNRAVEIGVPLSVCPDLREYESRGRQFHLGIKGSMQQVNASLALQIAGMWVNRVKDPAFCSQDCQRENEDIKEANTFMLSSQMIQGLEQCSWLGRNQKLTKPGLTYYLDGAHTLESIQQCVEWFQGEMCLEKMKEQSSYKVLIFNTTGDRDTSILLEPLKGCGFDAVLFCPNVAFLACNSADQTNRTVTKESQIHRCLANKNAWEKVNQDSSKHVEQGNHVVNGPGISVVSGNSIENHVVNGNALVNSGMDVVNGINEAKNEKEIVVNGHVSSESNSQDGPTSIKRARNEEKIVNSQTDCDFRTDVSAHKGHVKDENSNCNHKKSFFNKEVLSDRDDQLARTTVIHAFPSISHCFDWIMKGKELGDSCTQGRQSDKIAQGKSESEELEDSDDSLPDIGDKHVHILITGSLHLVGGALRVIEGENLCA